MSGIAKLFRTLALLLIACLASSLCWSAAPDYQVGAGDSLKVTVYENPDLTTEARVLQNGQIRLPLIELITVAGLTVDEIEDLVAQKLKDGNFVLHPHVNVAITNYRSQLVSVLGFVGKPGLYPLERVTKLSDLLAQVTGVLPTGADWLVIQRGEGKDHARIVVDLTQAFLDGDPAKDVAIRPGDIVFVPKAPVFYMQGEVKSPGPGRVEHGMTVHQALAAAGGVGPRGSDQAIRIKRRNERGEMEVRAAKLDEPVQADDLLIVDHYEFYIYGEVTRPGPYRIDPQLTFQQALTIGGGTTPRGNREGLRVYRKKPDGSTDVINDPKLTDPVHPDDVIFVKERLF